MKRNPIMRCKVSGKNLIAGLFLCALISSHASTVIISYNAGTNGVPATAPDPTSIEGGEWNMAAATLGENLVSEGLSPDPLHPNLNAWRAFDNLTTSGNVMFSKVATDEQVTNAIWAGWKASAYWRHVDPVPNNGGAITVFFQFGSTNALMNRRYLAYSEIDANGALYASWVNGSVLITTNADEALDYHLYEIIYDNATRTAQFRVDGKVFHENWPSLTIPASVDGCLWGTGSTGGRGDGYFNHVSVEVNDLAPTTVTLHPTNVTKNVAESHTFEAAFTGCATNLQWYKDGNPIPGANQRSYTIASIVPSDAGEYWMGIADPQTGTEVATAHATLTVNPDSTPPTVVSVTPSLSLQHITVKFSEGMDPTTAQDPLNYQIADDALTISNATLVDLTTVVLQTSDQAANSNYNLIISGIQDQSANTMLTVTQAFTSANLVSVARYDAGLEGNPEVPDPASVDGGRWTFLRGTNELLSAGEVLPDVGYGLNAWNITDNTTQTGQSIYYQFWMPEESHEFARTNGWRYRVRSRLVDDFTSPVGAILMLHGDASGRRYLIFFDLAGFDVDLAVQLPGAGGLSTTNLTSFGAGANDYHTHDIVFDPVTQSASYYFDGNLILSGWQGDTSAGFNGPAFGASSTAGMGSMNYNLVEFSVNNATPPVIVTNPVSTEVTVGQSARFDGFASGFVGGYQWYHNGNPIPGATGRTYIIPVVTAEHEGEYVLKAFTSEVVVESTPATLTVIAPPEINIDAAGGTVTVTFSDTLQIATNAAGPFIDLNPQPVSPLILTNPAGNSLFFRSRK